MMIAIALQFVTILTAVSAVGCASRVGTRTVNMHDGKAVTPKSGEQIDILLFGTSGSKKLWAYERKNGPVTFPSGNSSFELVGERAEVADETLKHSSNQSSR